MHKNDEIEDINVWEPKDDEKPYLIWGEDWEPLEITKITSAKSQKEKYNYLQKWRKENCDEVNKYEFNKRVEEVERRKTKSKYRNFAGLVLPSGKRESGNYNYAIFKKGTEFMVDNSKDENSERGYEFVGTKFQGRFTFNPNCKFYYDFPFAYATICKNSSISTFSNSEIYFKKLRTDSVIKEPFASLNIEEGGGFCFFDCSFPEGFTFKNLNLKNSSFRGSHIEKIRFINCEFDEKKGNFFQPARNIFVDEKNEEEPLPQFFGELAVTYQLMKKSFEEQKDYQTAGKFYVSEMVFRQKEATGIRKRFLFLYGFIAGYGESIWRTGFLLVFCILCSILLYYFSADSWEEAANQTLSSLLLFKNTDEIIFADILSRLLFIPAIFLFLNAIRRRLRRS